MTCIVNPLHNFHPKMHANHDNTALPPSMAHMLRHSAAPALVLGADGKVLLWNDSLAHATRVSASERLDRPLADALAVADNTGERGGIHEDACASQDPALWVREEKLRFKTATFGVVEEIVVSFTTVVNADSGSPTAIVGIGRTCDGQRFEQLYSRIFESANSLILGVDGDLRINLLNKTAAETLQLSSSEAVGKTFVDTFVAPEYRPMVSEVLSKILTGVEVANFEFPLITHRGSNVDTLFNFNPRTNPTGEIVGVVGIGQDITYRVAQEHEYFRLVDTANAVVLGIDCFGRVNEWNLKTEEVTGHLKSAVIGEPLVDSLVAPESQPRVRALLEEALGGAAVDNVELPITSPDNRVVVLVVGLSTAKDQRGKIRGAVAVGQIQRV